MYMQDLCSKATFTMRSAGSGSVLYSLYIGRLSMVTLEKKAGALLVGGVANIRLVFAAHFARFIFISNLLNIHIYVYVFICM